MLYRLLMKITNHPIVRAECQLIQNWAKPKRYKPMQCLTIYTTLKYCSNKRSIIVLGFKLTNQACHTRSLHIIKDYQYTHIICTLLHSLQCKSKLKSVFALLTFVLTRQQIYNVMITDYDQSLILHSYCTTFFVIICKQLILAGKGHLFLFSPETSAILLFISLPLVKAKTTEISCIKYYIK